MKKTVEEVPQVVEPVAVERQHPTFWQVKLGIHDVLHGMTYLVERWDRSTLVTQEVYEQAIRDMSFTAR